jgi:hypothetical protein
MCVFGVYNLSLILKFNKIKLIYQELTFLYGKK